MFVPYVCGFLDDMAFLYELEKLPKEKRDDPKEVQRIIEYLSDKLPITAIDTDSEGHYFQKIAGYKPADSKNYDNDDDVVFEQWYLDKREEANDKTREAT